MKNPWVTRAIPYPSPTTVPGTQRATFEQTSLIPGTKMSSKIDDTFLDTLSGPHA